MLSRTIIFTFFIYSVLTTMGAERNKLLYWINNYNPDKIINSPFEYVILDFSKDGSMEEAITQAKLKGIKQGRPDRTVLAYLSIGEAEDYRWYWQKDWKPGVCIPLWDGEPKFLGPANIYWPDNYIIDYRSAEWKKIVFSYLDIIIAQGFDGVYLDRVDAYELLKDAYGVENSRQEMEKFVMEISSYARKKNPAFKIFIQNAEKLALEEDDSGRLNRDFLRAIDGIGREETFYIGSQRRSEEEIHQVARFLEIFRNNNKTVFTIDYPPLNEQKTINWIYNQAQMRGFIEYCGPVELDKMIVY
ncbi:MAG: MJ1477/TM1410 family putative glycoside hydrolase [Vulcanimicrobiota bacterium]